MGGTRVYTFFRPAASIAIECCWPQVEMSLLFHRDLNSCRYWGRSVEIACFSCSNSIATATGLANSTAQDRLDFRLQRMIEFVGRRPWLSPSLGQRPAVIVVRKGCRFRPPLRGSRQRLRAEWPNLLDLLGDSVQDRSQARAVEIISIFAYRVAGAANYGSIFVPSSTRNLRIHSGWAGQADAVTSEPSTSALVYVAFGSIQRAPARMRSGRSAG